jgi:hypothetical protein
MTGAYREQVSHRILSERVDELVNSHAALERKLDIKDHRFLEAIACAAIAGGVPLAGFIAAQGDATAAEWRLLVPHADAEQTLIPAPGSWPVSEAYVRRVLHEVKSFNLEALVLKAYAVNPRGVTRIFARRGKLATEIVAVITCAEADGSADASRRLDLFLGVAARALWLTRDAVAEALRLADGLAEETLPAALLRLEQLGTSLQGEVPDTLIALLLLMVVGHRRFAGALDFNSADWLRFAALWARWLIRPGADFGFVPESILTPLRASYRALCEDVLRQAGLLNDQNVQFARLREFFEMGDVRAPLIQVWEDDWGSPDLNSRQAEDWITQFRLLFCMTSFATRKKEFRIGELSSLELCELAADKMRKQIPPSAREDEIAYTRISALARVILVLREHGGSSDRLKAAADESLTIAGAFLENEIVISAASRAMSLFSTALYDAGATYARLTEVRCQTENLLSRVPRTSRRAVEVVWAWGNCLANKGKQPANVAEREDILRHLDAEYAAFSTNPFVGAGATRWYNQILEIEIGKAGADRNIDDIMERINDAGTRLQEFADVQWSKANALAALSMYRAADPKSRDVSGATARAIDKIVGHWPGHTGLRAAQVGAWSAVAHARRLAGEDPGRVDEAVRMAQWFGSSNLDELYVAERISSALEDSAFVWAGSLGNVAMAEARARSIDEIARQYPANEPIASDQIRAWGHVLRARTKLSTTDAREYANVGLLMDRILEICDRFPPSDVIENERAFAWQYVAYARRNLGDTNERILEAVEMVRRIATEFPKASEIGRALEGAERVLARTTNFAPALPGLRYEVPETIPTASVQKNIRGGGPAHRDQD